MKITHREIVKVNGYTYSVIFDAHSKKWGGVREFSIASAAAYRKTKEEVLEWIEQDAKGRKY